MTEFNSWQLYAQRPVVQDTGNIVASYAVSAGVFAPRQVYSRDDIITSEVILSPKRIGIRVGNRYTQTLYIPEDAYLILSVNDPREVWVRSAGFETAEVQVLLIGWRKME